VSSGGSPIRGRGSSGPTRMSGPDPIACRAPATRRPRRDQWALDNKEHLPPRPSLPSVRLKEPCRKCSDMPTSAAQDSTRSLATMRSCASWTYSKSGDQATKSCAAVVRG